MFYEPLTFKLLFASSVEKRLFKFIGFSPFNLAYAIKSDCVTNQALISGAPTYCTTYSLLLLRIKYHLLELLDSLI